MLVHFPASAVRRIEKLAEFREVRDSQTPLYALLPVLHCGVTDLAILRIPFRPNGTLDLDIDTFNKCVFFVKRGSP